MNWSSSKDLKTKLMRIWERGDLLREALTENHHFPLRLSLKTPDSNDLSSRFDAVRFMGCRTGSKSCFASGIPGGQAPRPRCATIADKRVDRLLGRRSELAQQAP